MRGRPAAIQTTESSSSAWCWRRCGGAISPVACRLWWHQICAAVATTRFVLRLKKRVDRVFILLLGSSS
jgi:hypothetical protein